MINQQVTCRLCQHYTPNQVGDNGECGKWNAQIQRGVSTQQNENFYRVQLGGDSFYSNCEFIADEPRECLHFTGDYRFVVGD